MYLSGCKATFLRSCACEAKLWTCGLDGAAAAGIDFRAAEDISAVKAFPSATSIACRLVPGLYTARDNTQKRSAIFWQAIPACVNRGYLIVF